MRKASAVHANELGDLIYSLACGHEVQSIVRGVWGYTPALIWRVANSRQIRLDQPQRCYLCADQERETRV
jgi:hypothetical protein